MIRALAFFFGLLAAIFAVLAGLHALAGFLVPTRDQQKESQPAAVVLTKTNTHFHLAVPRGYANGPRGAA